jgi:hypothetical protein
MDAIDIEASDIQVLQDNLDEVPSSGSNFLERSIFAIGFKELSSSWTTKAA